MKKWMCVLALAALGGCYAPGGYVVRRMAPAEPPVSKEEAQRLTSAGVSDSVLTELIEKRGASPLGAEDLVDLKKGGVSDPIVQKMISSERKETAQTTVEDYYVAPGYYGYPYYPYPYYPYYYGPAVSVGVGWGWGYYGHYYGGCYPRGAVGVRVYR